MHVDDLDHWIDYYFEQKGITATTFTNSIGIDYNLIQFVADEIGDEFNATTLERECIYQIIEKRVNKELYDN